MSSERRSLPASLCLLPFPRVCRYFSEIRETGESWRRLGDRVEPLDAAESGFDVLTDDEGEYLVEPAVDWQFEFFDETRAVPFIPSEEAYFPLSVIRDGIQEQPCNRLSPVS